MSVGHDAGAIKSCCASIYGSDAAHLILGASFHPGGLALTLQTAGRLALTPEATVLDLAAGRGESALALAERFGCRVVGVDLAAANTRAADEAARARGSAERVSFVTADAETLPFADASFDALLCECAFCTFPDKPRAAREMARVLRPGGRLGLSDVVKRDGPLPADLVSLTAWAACVGDALTAEGYTAALTAAGFQTGVIERHDAALLALVETIRTRLLMVDVLAGLEKIPPPAFDRSAAAAMAASAQAAVRRGDLGYLSLIARRP